MNPFREDIKREAARAFLEACKQVGDWGTYSDRGETPVKIWFVPERVTRNLHKGGSVQEQHTKRDFAIPVQWCDGEQVFPPPGGPSTGAQIVYEDQTWTVQVEEGQAYRRDSVGAVYIVSATTHIPRRANP